MNHTAKKIVFALLLFISVCFMTFFSILSPYEEWNPNVVDYDMLDSLVFIWLVIFLLNSLWVFLTRSHKKFMIPFIVLLFISLCKLISLLWIQII